MRKVNNVSSTEHNVAEIENSKLRTKGLKSIEISAEKLDPAWLNFIDFERLEYNDLVQKYREQYRKVEFNVLLKILGYKDNFDQYLHDNWIIPYIQAEGKSMVFISHNWAGNITSYELQKKILGDFLKSYSSSERVTGIKYLDENDEIKFLDGIYVNNANKMIVTEDWIYVGPTFSSEQGTQFLCSKKHFLSRIEVDYMESMKAKNKKKEKDSYQEIFRIYQSIKLDSDKLDFSQLKKMSKDLKDYVATLPEVTYLWLTEDYLTIKLWWRWISDNQMRYTPRYVPPITLQYSFNDNYFYHKWSTWFHPHCLSSGQLCVGEMWQRMFNNIQEDFYIGIVKSMYEFGMTWSSDDAAGTTRMPQYCIKNYLEDKNISELTDENIMLIINECRFYDIINSCYFSKVKKRAEVILWGEIDMSSLIRNDHGRGKYFLIDSEEETPEIKIKEYPTQTVEMLVVLEDNDNEDGRYED